MSDPRTPPAVDARVASAARAASFRKLARRWPIWAAGGGAVLAIVVGFLMGEKRLTSEREKLLADIANFRGVLTSARAGRESRPQLDARIQAFADRTLGGSLETVDSEIRRRLNRACEEVGLTEFSVSTGTATTRSTPAKGEFRSPEQRRLREEPDFVEVQSTLTASGRIDKIFALMFRMEAEPWLKRVESFRLDPSADAEKVRLTLKMVNLFLPGRSPKEPLVLQPEALASASRYAALFSSNPFQLKTLPERAAARKGGRGGAEPPTAVGVTDPAALAAPNSPFPYAEWQITGIVDGPTGPEVWLRHLQNGTPLTLTPGAAIGELVLRGVEYDAALFDGFGASFRIQVGSNLMQRSSLGK
ncbi:MAG: hypothetical protein GC172_13480 [Phycisphaera sp.]|nr:hypothetical protein [Phycisphaera sp.]